MEWAAIIVIGAACGLLGGFLGKGGSAIATPLLAAVGVPPIVAVAAPLPATIPGTLVAGRTYARAGFVEWATVRGSIAAAVPAAIAGALATRWIDASVLVLVTDAIVVVVGLRLAVHAGADTDRRGLPITRGPRVPVIGAIVGAISGLLANGGGFLLAPLFITVLRFPVKFAFATSLTVATVIAVPATITHAALGHLDWPVVAVFAAAAVPLSRVGARLAIRTESARLERLAGILLALIAGTLLVRELVVH